MSDPNDNSAPQRLFDFLWENEPYIQSIGIIEDFDDNIEEYTIDEISLLPKYILDKYVDEYIIDKDASYAEVKLI